MRTVLSINWSEALDNLGRYEEALDVVDSGLALVEHLPDRKFYTLLLNNKACLLAALGKDREAAELAALSESYFSEDGYSRLVSLPSKDLGTRYLRLRQFQKGVEYLERSISLSEESDSRHLLPDLKELLAECYMGAGRAEDAFRVLKENLASLKKQYANQVIESGESRAIEQLEWIRREYDLLQDVNSEMVRARASVEESNRRKTELLANISHEIRTPMNGVIGLAKKLAATPLDSDQLSTVRNITKCGENLLNIVDEIISLTEIETGNLQIQRYNFDFLEFLEEIEMLFQPLCDAKNLTFELEVGVGVPPLVFGDASRIRQVVINLIGNAVKFTNAGTITLRVTRATEDPSSHRIRISVSDTGAGISKESQKAILHGESSRYSLNSRKFGGNGLGLTISRNIVAVLGGELGLTSELNVGSTFWFEIDLPAVSQLVDSGKLTLASEQDLIADKPLTGFRILVAEDNIINWLVIESLLSRLGASVSRASDGEETVKLEAMSLFDVILMDCHMPKISGYQASLMIREREAVTGNRKLILALSADVMSANKKLCLECGMDGFLGKPISTTELVEKIKTHRSQ
jgi:signal transduction histidine kinase